LKLDWTNADGVFIRTSSTFAVEPDGGPEKPAGGIIIDLVEEEDNLSLLSKIGQTVMDCYDVHDEIEVIQQRIENYRPKITQLGTDLTKLQADRGLVLAVIEEEKAHQQSLSDAWEKLVTERNRVIAEGVKRLDGLLTDLVNADNALAFKSGELDNEHRNYRLNADGRLLKENMLRQYNLELREMRARVKK
jgi:hypothetical protein